MKTNTLFNFKIKCLYPIKNYSYPIKNCSYPIKNCSYILV